MRKLTKRLFSLLLCAAMLVSLCPAAFAEGTETYLTWDEAEKKLVSADVPTSITEVTGDTIELKGDSTNGWYIVKGDVDIGTSEDPQRVTVTGNVHLILTDGCDLTVTGGIEVGVGNHLTVYGQSAGTGKLTASSENGTGIGLNAGSNGDSSTGGILEDTSGGITINGGTVKATGSGGGMGAGIAGETTTISGGTVEASGSGSASDPGENASGFGIFGVNVTINGGTVTAA